MRALNKLNKYRLKLNFWVSILLIFLASLALGYLSVIAAPAVSVSVAWEYFVNSSFLIYFFNVIPILLLMLGLFFVTNKVVVSGGTVALVVVTMSIVNRYKILYRQDPFRPWDVRLGGEVLSIFKGAQWFAFAAGFLAILLLVFIIGVVAFFFGNKPVNYKVRLVCFGVTALAILYANMSIYTNQSLNNSFQIYGNRYNQVNIYNSRGFLYSFLYDLNTNKVKKPEGYKAKEIEELIKATEQPAVLSATEPKKPHVFFILSESFSEMANDQNFSFSGTQPLENYNRLKAESISGYIVPSGFGGGTADTEFDILTGLSARDFSGVPYANLLVTREMESLASILKKVGYEKNVAIHPGFGWFYNRNNVLKFFGFEKFLERGVFDAKDEKGYYINEKVTFDKVIEEFNEYKKSGGTSPFFEFCITIQNHGPYTDKYPTGLEFESQLPLADSDKNDLANYFEGLKDADRELGRFTNFLNTIDEPAVVVYFGDHMPYLTSAAYDLIIPPTDEVDPIRLHKSPYIVWQNNAARNEGIIETDEKDMGVMSAFYLGAYVTKLLGFDSASPYFSFLNKLREQYPIILKNEFYDREMKIHNRLEEKSDDLSLFEKWEYFKIFEK